MKEAAQGKGPYSNQRGATCASRSCQVWPWRAPASACPPPPVATAVNLPTSQPGCRTLMVGGVEDSLPIPWRPRDPRALRPGTLAELCETVRPSCVRMRVRA